MQKDGNSRALFVLDLTIIYGCFFGVYVYYKGWIAIPFKAVLLMGFVGSLWFFIAINSNISRVNHRTGVLDILKNVLAGYSVLSAAVVASVAIWGNFRPNDKLVLYPLLYAVVLSSVSGRIHLVRTRILSIGPFTSTTQGLVCSFGDIRLWDCHIYAIEGGTTTQGLVVQAQGSIWMQGGSIFTFDASGTVKDVAISGTGSINLTDVDHDRSKVDGTPVYNTFSDSPMVASPVAGSQHDVLVDWLDGGRLDVIQA